MDDSLTGLYLANEDPKLGHNEQYFSPLTGKEGAFMTMTDAQSLNSATWWCLMCDE
jgi:hypothetical protein